MRPFTICDTFKKGHSAHTKFLIGIADQAVLKPTQHKNLLLTYDTVHSNPRPQSCQTKAAHFNNLYFDYRCITFFGEWVEGALVLFTIGLKMFISVQI